MINPIRKTATRATMIAMLALSASATPASAQYLTKQGTIFNTYVSSGENYGFRISLQNNGADALTDCLGSFAYINSSYSNYNTIVATLMTNYNRGRPVGLTVQKDANGYCQILEVGG